MRKIIFCLLLFNVLFFISIKFTFADVVNLGKLPDCGFVDGTTNCRNGSYYYVNSVPASGTKIMSSGRVVRVIRFQGSGYFELFDKSGNLIERLDVNSSDRVGVYVFTKRVYSYTYFGVDLIATEFRQDGGNAGIVVAYKPYSKDLQEFLSGGYLTPEQLPKPDPEPDPEPEVKPGCDICNKLSGILEDTNKINNNISQLKITTGYINSHLSQIKDNISDNSLILAKVRQTLDTMRMQDLDRNDSLDSIDNKLDNLESIDNNLEGIKDEIDTIVDDFAPTIIPDFSGQIQKPDLPVLDIPTIKKQEDTNVYFSEQEFEGEASPFPFAEGPKPWKNVDGKEIVIEDFDRDSPFDKDKSLIRDDSMKSEKMERDEPLQREEMDRDEIKRDEPLEVEKPLKRDEPLELKEMDRDEINRDEPLEVEKFLRRDEPLEVEENSYE